MKILVFVACVLTIASTVYTVEVENAVDDFINCANELNEPRSFSLNVIKCMFKKGSLLDEQGAMKKDEILKYFNSVTSERQLQDIALCIDYETDENRRDESNDKKTYAAMRCIRYKLSLLRLHY